MDLQDEAKRLLLIQPRLSFFEWEKALKNGAVGIQDGNVSQRWAYRSGYFVELVEYEDYLNGLRYADSPSTMNQRFYRNLNTARRGLIITSVILVGGE